jgi:hypothetical protein
MMAMWAASANVLFEAGTSTIETPGNSVFTPTSEMFTSAVERFGDRYRLGSWRHLQEPTSPAPSSTTSDADQPRQRGGSRPSPERVLGLRKWEGRILEFSDGLLTAELTPSDHDGPELVADFDASLLGPDSSSAAPGDTIYLTTRTVRDAVGYLYQTSSLKLRRPGSWGEGELREIRDAAEKRAEFFKGIY